MAAYCFSTYSNQLNTKRFVDTGYISSSLLGTWLLLSPLVGGIFGCSVGGFLTDFISSKERFGPVKSRLIVMAVSQLIAGPVALADLFLPYPWSFLTLTLAYFFAEMWYGCLFAVLFDLLPENGAKYNTTFFGLFMFVINIFASNMTFMVQVISSNLQVSLGILYAGGYFTGGVIFMLTFLVY